VVFSVGFYGVTDNALTEQDRGKHKKGITINLKFSPVMVLTALYFTNKSS
jgi:hypothetical protein